MIQITKVQINDLLLYVNIQAENVMLFRPYFGEMWFIDCSLHAKGVMRIEYMSIGWRQQFSH